jgi:hypothetical protein
LLLRKRAGLRTVWVLPEPSHGSPVSGWVLGTRLGGLALLRRSVRALSFLLQSGVSGLRDVLDLPERAVRSSGLAVLRGVVRVGSHVPNGSLSMTALVPPRCAGRHSPQRSS